MGPSIFFFRHPLSVHFFSFFSLFFLHKRCCVLSLFHDNSTLQLQRWAVGVGVGFLFKMCCLDLFTCVRKVWKEVNLNDTCTCSCTLFITEAREGFRLTLFANYHYRSQKKCDRCPPHPLPT